MKIDLPVSLDLSVFDTFEALVIVLLLSQAAIFFHWVRKDMKKCNSPVERLVRDRYFGGV